MNQSIETAQALVDYYQAQLELTPQYKLLQTAKKNLAELKDKEREEQKLSAMRINTVSKTLLRNSSLQFFEILDTLLLNNELTHHLPSRVSSMSK